MVFFSSASVTVIASILRSVDTMSLSDSTPFLRAAETRLGALGTELDLVRALGIAGTSGLAAFFARVHRPHEKIVALVLKMLSIPLNKIGEKAGIDDGIVAELAFICHTFNITCHGKLGWLVPHVVSMVGHCEVTVLAKVLPVLASIRKDCADANVAFMKVLKQRIPWMFSSRTTSSALDAAAPRLIEALAIAEERDLVVITRLCVRCLRIARSLDVCSVVTIAASLRQLRVRQERLLVELAENLIVQPAGALQAAEVEAVARAWISLKVPYNDLVAALRYQWSNMQPQTNQLEIVNLLDEFATLEGPRLMSFSDVSTDNMRVDSTD